MTLTEIVHFRASAQELEEWQGVAQGSLSRWIRRCLNEEVQAEHARLADRDREREQRARIRSIFPEDPEL